MLTQILVKVRIAPLSILRDVREQTVQIDREQQVMRLCDLKVRITRLEECAQQRPVVTLFGILSVLALGARGRGAVQRRFARCRVAYQHRVCRSGAPRRTSAVVWIIMPRNRAKRVFPMGIIRCRGARIGSTERFSNKP